ncbi:hypothetical protein [Thiomicrorhabdus sp.]|uniref:hypothetical protein n=1 Tax=Thiomicrorhabdus sp. TaxID=2039724 RepID=UPI003567D6B3
MKTIVFISIFFIVFFRIPVFYTGIYLSLFLGFFASFFLLQKNIRRFFLNALGLNLLVVFFTITIFALAIDISTGALINNLTNAFTLRASMIVVMSALPALFVVWFFVKNEGVKLSKIVYWAFAGQLVFWLYTFFVPGGKDFIYALMAMSNSVNIIHEWNYYTRGFGYAVEINYTSPFVMVLTAFTLLGVRLLSLATLVTQIFNSNNVAVALLMGMLTRGTKNNVVKVFFGIATFILTVSVLVFFYSDYLPTRLQAELNSGGTRTIGYLLENHFIFLNTGWFEVLFGTGNYLFQSGHKISVDSGWVILVNYGGLFFTSLVFIFLFLLSFRAFDNKFISLIWFSAGLWLNFKGLLFSPNAYLFMLFLFLFHRLYKRKIVAKE